MEYIFSAPSHKLFVIKVGSPTHYAVMKEMELVKNWVDLHRKNWPDNFAECPLHSSVPISLEVLPETDSNKEYVLKVDSPGISNDDHYNSWKEVLSEAEKEENFIILCAHTIQIKKINKTLLPFI